MAMPQMEQVENPDAWLHALAAAVRATPTGVERTLFELQTVDWRVPAPLPGDTLRAQSRLLQAAGIRHLGYYPDDFIGNQPTLEDAREACERRVVATALARHGGRCACAARELGLSRQGLAKAMKRLGVERTSGR